MLLNALILPALGELPSSCLTTLTPTNSIKPSIASGYRAALVATGLTYPRSIQFDASGNLLVVEQSTGLTSLHFDDNEGICVSVKSQKVVVEATNVTFISLIEKYPHAHIERSSPMAWLYRGTVIPFTHHRRRRPIRGLTIQQIRPFQILVGHSSQECLQILIIRGRLDASHVPENRRYVDHQSRQFRERRPCSGGNFFWPESNQSI